MKPRHNYCTANFEHSAAGESEENFRFPLKRFPLCLTRGQTKPNESSESLRTKITNREARPSPSQVSAICMRVCVCVCVCLCVC